MNHQKLESVYKSPDVKKIPILLAVGAICGLMIIHFYEFILPIFSGLLLVTGFIMNPLYGISILNIFRSMLTYNIIEIGSYNFTFEGILTFLLIPIGIIYFLYKKLRIFKGLSVKPFFLLILYCSFGIFYVQDYIEFFRKMARLSSYFILYLIILDLSKNRKNIKWLTSSIFIAMIGPMFIGIFEAIYNVPAADFDILPQKGYVHGFMSKNAFGFFTAFMIIFSTCFYINIKKFQKRLLLFITIMILTALLLLSLTRAAWLGVAAGIFVLLLLVKRGKGYFIIIIALSLMLYLFYPIIKNAVLDIILEKSGETTSWTVRKDLIWPATWKAFLKSPVYGHGLGSDTDVIEPVKVVQGYFTYSPHNDYLNMLVETGLIGFGLYIWLIYSLLMPLLKGLKDWAKDELTLSLCLAGISVLAAYLVGGIFEHLLQSPGPGGYFFTIIAIAHGAVLNQGRFKPLSSLRSH